MEITLGTGTLEKARKALSSRAYQLYAQQAKAEGETVMSEEDWMAQRAKEKAEERAAFKASFNGEK